MPERRVVVNWVSIKYDGLFNLNELYLMIENWFRQKGYDWLELKNYEQSLKTGKDIEIDLWPYKKISDYHKLNLRVYFLVKEMKDVSVKKDGTDIGMNQGTLHIRFKGYMDTDYDDRWGGKPFMFFLRHIFDNIIYAFLTKKSAGILSEDIEHLSSYVKNYLNMSKKPFY